MKTKDKKRKKSAIIRHGVYAQRDKLPAQVKREANLLRDRIIDDIAGEEDKLSGAELMLLDRAINVYAVIRKIELHIARHGIINAEDKLHPILSNNYITYVNSLRLILREIGIKRARDDQFDVLAYVKEKYGDDK